MARRSNVSSLVDFHADETPKWRKELTRAPSVERMIQDISRYQTIWEESVENINPDLLKKTHRDFLVRFIYHINVEEEHGCDTIEDVEQCLLKTYSTLKRQTSLEEKETINLHRTYDYLMNQVKRGDQDYGLLEMGVLTEAHKIILHDIQLQPNQTKAGELSKYRRFTEWKGEKYEYKNPQDMGAALVTVLDRYNDLIDSVKTEENEVKRVYKHFKICAWMLYELLDLHPFSDGNGRLCRLLCSYALGTMTPFPSPIYNIWSESRKDDYKQALVDARKSENGHPESLATMIIECNWYGWREFYKALGHTVTD